jgi:hypothetical protein
MSRVFFAGSFQRYHPHRRFQVIPEAHVQVAPVRRVGKGDDG